MNGKKSEQNLFRWFSLNWISFLSLAHSLSISIRQKNTHRECKENKDIQQLNTYTYGKWYMCVYCLDEVKIFQSQFTLNRRNNKQERKKIEDKCIYNRIACVYCMLFHSMYLDVSHFKLSVCFHRVWHTHKIST